jgi:hypothetical protein
VRQRRTAAMSTLPVAFAEAAERGAYPSFRDLLDLDAPPLVELRPPPRWSRGGGSGSRY